MVLERLLKSLKDSAVDNVATITNVDLFVESWERENSNDEKFIQILSERLEKDASYLAQMSLKSDPDAKYIKMCEEVLDIIEWLNRK